MRQALLALSLVFLIAHAACLPSTFADVDAINFALGVRDFDVSKHQPHPPGYPIFIAAAKASTAVAGAIGVPAPEVRGLAILSAIAGALLIPLLFWFSRELMGDDAVAGWAAVVTALSPLFWFNAARPLSDLTGLAIVVCAQALIVSVIFDRRHSRAAFRLVAGAVIAGVAIGVRSQNFVLTLPLLGLALVTPGTGLRHRDRLAAVLAAVLGGLVWFVPLLLASGGPDAYLAALRDQASEDFSGVAMLWTTRTARAVIDAVEYSFLWPWGTLLAGWIVVAVAAGGAIRMLLLKPLALAVVAIAFVPYAVFHLLFQETLTTRYAMPLVIPVGVLAVYAMAGAGRIALHGAGGVLVAWSLAMAVPGAIDYGSRPTPSASALQDALAADPKSPIGLHAVMLRSEQWYHGNASGRVIRRRHGDEVNALVDHWRGDPNATILFIADPRRSDLARLDSRARRLERDYDWAFDELPLLGGVRPGPVRLFRLAPPRWMLGDGWAITPEIGGQTDRAGTGPHRRPSVAWVRAHNESATLMVGGRNLGVDGADETVITVQSGERVVASFTTQPGFFFQRWELPGGALAGPGPWLPFKVTATARGEHTVPVGLEQFDLQPAGVPMVGYLQGWQEPEYEPLTGRSWRWMSERAHLWVRDVGRDVRLELQGESPLRYFDTPPAVTVTVGGRELVRFSPEDDFTQVITIPAADLANGGQHVVVQSSQSFVPGGDQRNLALRIYSVTVN